MVLVMCGTTCTVILGLELGLGLGLGERTGRRIARRIAGVEMIVGHMARYIYIIYSVRLSVHEDVTPQGVNPPLQLLLPLNLTVVALPSLPKSLSAFF
jgi:hypothetical protein